MQAVQANASSASAATIPAPVRPRLKLRVTSLRESERQQRHTGWGYPSRNDMNQRSSPAKRDVPDRGAKRIKVNASQNHVRPRQGAATGHARQSAFVAASTSSA